MKGLGNYRQLQAPKKVIERRLAQLIVFHGPRASIRYIDGTTYAMPAAPLQKLGLLPEETFVLVIEWSGRNPVSVTAERRPEARGAAPARSQPKVMVRRGLKLTTRR
jgi:hypothetical protein